MSLVVTFCVTCTAASYAFFPSFTVLKIQSGLKYFKWSEKNQFGEDDLGAVL